MIIGFYGNKGNGKTLIAVKTLRELYGKGYQIFSNIWLNFPFNKLTIDYCLAIAEGHSQPPNNAVFFIDEIALWLDSRNLTKTTRILTYMLLMNRHLGSNKALGMPFLYTTQFPRLIDIRLWLTTDYMVICEKETIGPYEIIKQEWIQIKINGNESTEQITIGNFYWHLYNTQQWVALPISKYDKKYG